MTDMIERAVRAMCDVMGEPPCDYPACGCGADALLVRQARAAIEAMREPTEAMLDASDAAVWKHITDPRPSRTAWLAMIDAALNPAGEPK